MSGQCSMGAMQSASAWLAVGVALQVLPATASHAQESIGLGGIVAEATPDQAAAALGDQGLRVFSRSAKYIEVAMSDAATQAPVRARLMFDDGGRVRLKSVEFVEDDDKFARQYIAWYAKLTSQYGVGTGDSEGSVLKFHFCHNRDVSIVLALFEQRAALAYFHNVDGGGPCRRASLPKREFEATLYDFRTPEQQRQAKASRSTAALPPEPRQSERQPERPAERLPEPRNAASGPSPLVYAANRSQRYQDVLRCISVAAFYAASGDGQQGRWKAQAQGLSGNLVGLGRAEGLSPAQVEAEGRSIVDRNHPAYAQGKRSSSGNSYLDLDRNYCRANGLLSG